MDGSDTMVCFWVNFIVCMIFTILIAAKVKNPILIVCSFILSACLAVCATIFWVIGYGVASIMDGFGCFFCCVVFTIWSVYIGALIIRAINQLAPLTVLCMINLVVGYFCA